MAEILLFHHAQGLTDGIRAFADEIRAAGHGVTVPDLYAGRTFETVEAGVAHAESVGFDGIVAAGVALAEDLPNDLVYAGFSLGVMPAQRLAQGRPGARGALLYHSGLPVSAFGDAWPDGVPLQAHVMRGDPWGDVEVVADLARQAGGEAFLYDGNAHLFTDASLDAYDPAAAELVMRRTLAFLDAVERDPVRAPSGGSRAD